MNKHSSLIFLLCLLLAAGCTSSSFPDDNEYHPDRDHPYMFYEQGPGLRTASTEKGYYFLHQKLIYYMDKESTKPVLLDNRPDNQCLNNANDDLDPDNCYALVRFATPSSPDFLQYYDSHLYVLESYWDEESKRSRFDKGWTLTRLDPDGRNRKIINIFDSEPLSLSIHRGYLYYTTADASKDNDQQANVFKIKLNNLNREPELIYHAPDQVRSITDIIPYGTQLYWIVFNKKGYVAQRYDLHSGQVTTLWDRGDGGL